MSVIFWKQSITFEVFLHWLQFNFSLTVLLFSKNKPWEKTIYKSLFDVTMGSYDGVEICELVGFYIVSILGKMYEIQNLSLYRDDVLACLQKISGPASVKIRKDIIRTFWENFGLKITITKNLKTVNFFDVTFNLCTGKYQQYEKPNDTATYINANSNHPSNIIRALLNQNLIMPHLSLTTYCLRVGTKKILVINNI